MQTTAGGGANFPFWIFLIFLIGGDVSVFGDYLAGEKENFVGEGGGRLGIDPEHATRCRSEQCDSRVDFDAEQADVVIKARGLGKCEHAGEDVLEDVIE
ncbi:MAG: hypothetical protein RLZZ282_1188 [Verrucomicrobiota bacterium]